MSRPPPLKGEKTKRIMSQTILYNNSLSPLGVRVKVFRRILCLKIILKPLGGIFVKTNCFLPLTSWGYRWA
jgi:hypothetical protein